MPHTTALRGNRWESRLTKSFLKDGVFHLRQIQSVPTIRLMRRLGESSEQEMRIVHVRLREYFAMWLKGASNYNTSTRS